MGELNDVIEQIRKFRDKRDWAQFHNPKDMAIAISLEAGELLEHFLWKGPEEVEARIRSHQEEIEEEIADIAIYLFELADNLGVDLLAAVHEKIEKNDAKYPAAQVKGSSKKYSEYDSEPESAK